MMPALARDEGSPITDHTNMGAYWDRRVADDPARDPGELADRIEGAATRFLAAADESGWDRSIGWHGGLKAPVATLCGFMINECEVHGHDVASAEGKPWAIDPDRARFIIDAHLPILPYFTKRETLEKLDAVFQLDIRGGSRIYLTAKEGELTIDTDRPTRVDCRISVDPVEYLLVGYGRKSQWGPILTGKILSFGRKPWLGLTFGKLFESV
jgi:uncharacterized protein (TIGR03083 family)